MSLLSHSNVSRQVIPTGNLMDISFHLENIFNPKCKYINLTLCQVHIYFLIYLENFYFGLFLVILHIKTSSYYDIAL